MSGQLKMYDGKVYGFEVSQYGKDNGYLDYRTLSKIVGSCILNNQIREETMCDHWEMVNGEFDEMVYQDYIITESGYEFLKEHTDELVFYNPKLDIYVWAITHFGTAWDYVLTDIEIY